ncbi:MAG TPA: SpoIIE family protein phosphatase [Verrucomicrobiae bacterium]
MESDTLKVLFVGNDAPFAQVIADKMQEIGGTVEVSGFETAVALLKTNSFKALLFEPEQINTAALFKITSLAVRMPAMPIIVFGPGGNDAFAVEAVCAGAQDFLAKETVDAGFLNRTIRCAIERQFERMALVKEKENYYGIFDHLVEGIFRTTPEGQFLLANMALARIYGYASPPDLMARVTDIASKLYVDAGRREEFVRVMQANDTITDFESRIYRKDGEIIWISENCRAMCDANGKLLYYEGTVEDITERKHSEEEIRRTTAELSRSREEMRLKNELREENLRTAREIQTAMLPQQFPVFPRHVAPEHSAFRFTHRYQPAEAVSGDFFSVAQLSDSEVGILICDVTGHGVRAALVTAMIRALSEELKPLAREPGFFLRKLNFDLGNILKSTGSPMLTTAFYMVANCQTGVMRFANAGHPKPLLLRRSENRIEPLGNACGHGQPALGLFEEPPYETSETILAPGDFVMLFTDGLYEVQGLHEELYSQQRMMLDLQNLMQKSGEQLFDELMATIRAFSIDHEFEDDVCIVGMEFSRSPDQKKS